MAKHGLANFVNLAGQTAAGALPGILTLNPVLAAVGGGFGAANASYQNVKGHRERKEAEKMAKNQQNPKNKKGGFFDSEAARTEQLPLHSPEQIAARNALLPQTVQRLQSNQYDIEPLVQKSNEDFRRYTEPSIANRFSAHGGGTSTGAYKQALATAAREQQSGVDSLRAQYGLAQQTQQQNLFSTLMDRSHENLYFPQQNSFAQRLAEGLIPQVAGQAIQSGVQALGNVGASYFANRNQQQSVPTAPQVPQTAGAAQTIGAASTAQGQATQALAQSAQPVNQLGGAGANVAKQSGLSTAGKAGIGLLGSAGLYGLSSYVTDLLRRG